MTTRKNNIERVDFDAIVKQRPEVISSMDTLEATSKLNLDDLDILKESSSAEKLHFAWLVEKNETGKSNLKKWHSEYQEPMAKPESLHKWPTSSDVEEDESLARWRQHNYKKVVRELNLLESEEESDEISISKPKNVSTDVIINSSISTATDDDSNLGSSNEELEVKTPADQYLGPLSGIRQISLSDTATCNTRFLQPKNLGKQIALDLFPDEKPGEFDGDIRSMLQIAKFRSDYKVIKQLGSGGHATVHLAQEIATKRQVAAKFINAANVWHWKKVGDRKIPLEIDMMSTLLKLKVPGIIQYQKHFEIGNRFIIIMEYLGENWIDLYDYIEFYGPLSEDITMRIFKSVVSTIGTMHGLGYTHNDIKDENVMINKHTLETKLIDFGSAMDLDDRKTNVFYGTQKFSCPEALGGNEYTPAKQEVWALGTLLYVMLFKMDPFANDQEIESLDIEKRMKRLIGGNYDFKVSENMVQAIAAMLEKDPICRPTLDEIVQMPIYRT